MENLPLQIALFHKIAVDQAQGADPGPHQLLRGHAAQGPAADDHHPRPAQSILPVGADGGEEDLTRIALVHDWVPESPDQCSTGMPFSSPASCMAFHSSRKVWFQVSVSGCFIITWNMFQKMMMPSAPSRSAW